MRNRAVRDRIGTFPLSCLALLACLTAAPVAALTAPPPLASLEESDREALDRIAVAPIAVRESVLLASQHVDVLVDVQRIQERSSQDFSERIEVVDRETQEQLWEIVREPGLLEALAGRGPRSTSQLEEIAAEHPPSLAPAIRALGSEHAQLLDHVLQIQRRANEHFELRLREVSDEASRDAFRDLLAEPELLSLLARRVELVVRLGDSFREDPDAVRAHLASLGEEVAARDARARDDWLQALNEDSAAAEELEASARAYADEYGYEYEDLTDPEVRTRVEVVVRPYPYWFGYPLWYADVHLFPYGYWYPVVPHFGFYHHHHHHRYVWFGLPSVHFTGWFFSRHHHHRYRHLAHGFDRHYGRHRYARTGFHATVGNWVHWRDRDHRHGSSRHHGRRHRGSSDGGVFVSLFDRARFGNHDRSWGGDRWRRSDRDGRDGRRDRGDEGFSGRRGRGDGDARDGDRRSDRRRERGDQTRGRERDGERGSRAGEGWSGSGRDGDRSWRRDDDGDRRRERGESRSGERAERGDRDRDEARSSRGDRDRDDARSNRSNRDRDDARSNRGDRNRDDARSSRGNRDRERAARDRRDRDRSRVRIEGSRGDRNRVERQSRDTNSRRIARPERRSDRDESRIRVRDHRSDRDESRVRVRDHRSENARRGGSDTGRQRSQRDRGISSRGSNRSPSVGAGRSSSPRVERNAGRSTRGPRMNRGGGGGRRSGAAAGGRGNRGGGRGGGRGR